MAENRIPIVEHSPEMVRLAEALWTEARRYSDELDRRHGPAEGAGTGRPAAQHAVMALLEAASGRGEAGMALQGIAFSVGAAAEAFPEPTKVLKSCIGLMTTGMLQCSQAREQILGGAPRTRQ